MKLFNWLTTGLASLALVACGGGGTLTSPTTPTTPTTPAAATVELSTSATQIGSGSGVATITATVKDASNVSVPAAPVTFSADSGVLSNAAATTGTNGTATVELSAGADKTNRTITVTVRSGTASKTIQVQIVEALRKIELTTSSTTIQSGGEVATLTAVVKDENNVSLASAPVTFSTTSGTLTDASTVTNTSGLASAKLSAGANKSNRTITVTVASGNVSQKIDVAVGGTALQYTGVSTLQLGTASEVVVAVLDSLKVGVAGVPVQASSRLNNGLSATSVTTDSSGNARFTYTATNAGDDVLTFTSSGATVAQALKVNSQNFAFVSPAPSAAIRVGESQNVTVRYVVGSTPRAGEVVSFSATAGIVTPAQATTNAAGEATVSISSLSASPATIVARLQSVSAEASLPVRFVAFNASKLVLQATPAALPPNEAGKRDQQATLIATVTDPSGNPVPGIFVNFNRVEDPSSGDLSQPSAQTNSSGQAIVQYYSGTKATANNGVRISASVADKPSVAGEVRITVNQRALFIALGTNNDIQSANPPFNTAYKKNWVVYVTDANGVAVSGVSVTMNLEPVFYLKGQMKWVAPAWTTDRSKISDLEYAAGYGALACPNEDLNFNGVLDAGEDTNGNNVLEPGQKVTIAPGVVVTDSSGRANVEITYAESYAPWIDLKLVARASVDGTESVTSQRYVLGISAEDVSSEAVPPAGVVSPFGIGRSCAIPG